MPLHRDLGAATAALSATDCYFSSDIARDRHSCSGVVLILDAKACVVSVVFLSDDLEAVASV